MKFPKYICPNCRQKTGVDILFGMPSGEAFKLAEQGEIALGGCCIDLDGPHRHCTACGHEWRIRRRIGPLVKKLKKERDESNGAITLSDDEIVAFVSEGAR